MYRQRGRLDLEAIVSKIRRKNQAKAYSLKYMPAPPPAATPYKRISYATSDINAAKTVLQRLLDQSSAEEVCSIQEVAKEVEI